MSALTLQKSSAKSVRQRECFWENKPVDVEVIADSGDYFVVLDPIKVRQILTSLMSNAAKFTDRGSIVLSLSAEKDRIRISVSDTCIGIKEQDLDKNFSKHSASLRTQKKITKAPNLD